MAGKTSHIYCYIRLSGSEQQKKHRLKVVEDYIAKNSLEEYSLSRIKESLSANVLTENREKLVGILNKLKKKDVIVVVERKDLGRDYTDIISTLTQIKKKQSKVCIIELPLMNNWYFIEEGEHHNDAIDLLIDDFKEIDRLDKAYRTLSVQKKMDNLHKENKKVGRPVSDVPQETKELILQYRAGELDVYNLGAFLERAKISKQSYYNYLKKMRDAGEID